MKQERLTRAARAWHEDQSQREQQKPQRGRSTSRRRGSRRLSNVVNRCLRDRWSVIDNHLLNDNRQVEVAGQRWQDGGLLIGPECVGRVDRSLLEQSCTSCTEAQQTIGNQAQGRKPKSRTVVGNEAALVQMKKCALIFLFGHAKCIGGPAPGRNYNICDYKAACN